MVGSEWGPDGDVASPPMRRPSVRTVFLLGVIVGLVAAVLRAARRDARPAPTAPLAPPPRPLPDPAPVVEVSVPVVEAPEPVVEVPVPTAATPPAHAPEPDEAEVDEDATAEAEARTWVEPVDGACPDGYPIKAKASSGIFHQPGGLSYDRTVPDRCYPDAATAEADGYRPAKR